MLARYDNESALVTIGDCQIVFFTHMSNQFDYVDQFGCHSSHPDLEGRHSQVEMVVGKTSGVRIT